MLPKWMNVDDFKYQDFPKLDVRELNWWEAQDPQDPSSKKHRVFYGKRFSVSVGISLKTSTTWNI